MEIAVSNILELQDGISDLDVALGEITQALEQPSFNIRNYVFAVRSKDFSKCWPFPKKYLDGCLHKGMEAQLPPFDPRPNISQFLTDENQDLDGFINSAYQKGVNLNSTATPHHLGANDQEVVNMLNVILPEAFAPYSETQNETVNNGGYPEYKKENIELKNEIERIQRSYATLLRDNHEAESKVVQAGEETSSRHVAQELEEHGNVDIVSGGVQEENTIAALELPCLIMPQNLNNLEMLDVAGTKSGEDSSAAPKHLFENQHSSEGTQSLTNTNPGENGCATPKLPEMGSTIKSINLYLPENNAAKLVNDEHFMVVNKSDASKNGCNTGATTNICDVLLPQVCPVCRAFATSSNTALNAHIDHCLAVVPPTDTCQSIPLKHKMRTRKKRSMLDICAVAPIRTLEDLDRYTTEQWAIDEPAINKSGISCSFDWSGSGIMRQPRTSSRRGSTGSYRQVILMEQKEKRQFLVSDIVQERTHHFNKENTLQGPHMEDSQLSYSDNAGKVCKAPTHQDNGSAALKALKKLDTSNAAFMEISSITNEEPGCGKLKNLMCKEAKPVIPTDCTPRQPNRRVPYIGRSEMIAHGLTDMGNCSHLPPPSIENPIFDSCHHLSSIPKRNIRCDTTESSPELVAINVVKNKKDFLNFLSSSGTANRKSHRRAASKFTVNKRNRKNKKLQGPPRLKTAVGTSINVSRSNKEMTLSSYAGELECQGIMPIDTSAEEANKLLARMMPATTGGQHHHVCQTIDLVEASESLEQFCSFKDESEAAMSNEKALFSVSNYLSKACKVHKPVCDKPCRHQESSFESGKVKQFQRLNNKCPLKIKKITNIGTCLKAKESFTDEQPAIVSIEDKRRISNASLRQLIVDCSSLQKSTDNIDHSQILKRKSSEKVPSVANVHRKSKCQKTGSCDSQLSLINVNCSSQRCTPPEDSSVLSDAPLDEHEMDVGWKAFSYPIDAGNHALEVLSLNVTKNKEAKEINGKIQVLGVPSNVESYVSTLSFQKIRSKTNCFDQKVPGCGKIRAAQMHPAQAVSKGELCHPSFVQAHGDIANSVVQPDGKIQVLGLPSNVESYVSTLSSQEIRSKTNCFVQKVPRCDKITTVQMHPPQRASKNELCKPSFVQAHGTIADSVAKPELLKRRTSTSTHHGGTSFINVTEALKERMQSLSLQKQTLNQSSSLSCSSIPTFLNSTTTYSNRICASSISDKMAVIPPDICSKLSNDLGKETCVASELAGVLNYQSVDNVNMVTSESFSSAGLQSSLSAPTYGMSGKIDSSFEKADEDKIVLCINQNVQSISDKARNVTDSFLPMRRELIHGATAGETSENFQKSDVANHIISTESLNKAINHINPSTLTGLLVSCTSQGVTPEIYIPMSEGNSQEQECNLNFMHPNTVANVIYDTVPTTGISKCYMDSQRDKAMVSFPDAAFLDNISNNKEWQVTLKNSKEQLAHFQTTEHVLIGDGYKDSGVEPFDHYNPRTTSLLNNNASYASEVDNLNILPDNLNGTEWLQSFHSNQPTIYLSPSSGLLKEDVCSIGLGLTSSLNDFQCVEYSGEHGVVHILGNPVFKLMGKNVMVSNKDGKGLERANSNMSDNSRGLFQNANVSRNFNCMKVSAAMNMTGTNTCCLFEFPLHDAALLNKESLFSESGRWQTEASFGFMGRHKGSEAGMNGPFMSKISSEFGNIESTGTSDCLKHGASGATSGLLSVSGDRSRLHYSNQMIAPSMNKFTRCLEDISIDDCLLNNNICSMSHRDNYFVQQDGTFCKGTEEINTCDYQNQHSGILSGILQSAAQGSQGRLWSAVPGTMLART